jgi:hypothetical protein
MKPLFSPALTWALVILFAVVLLAVVTEVLR